MIANRLGDGLVVECWNTKGGADGGHARLNDKMPSAGIYGHYGCDSPWALIESAANAMKANHGDGIEFVLWSGYVPSSTRIFIMVMVMVMRQAIRKCFQLSKAAILHDNR